MSLNLKYNSAFHLLLSLCIISNWCKNPIFSIADKFENYMKVDLVVDKMLVPAKQKLILVH